VVLRTTHATNHGAIRNTQYVTPMPRTEDLLQQGIAAARAGQREEARALLVQAVEADERNEQAWLWLAGVVDDPEDMRTCLENALDLNPGNVKAQQGLAWIEARYGPRPAPEPEPAAAPDEPQEAASYTGPTTKLASAAAAAAAATPASPPAAPAPAEVATPPENPCPYCGAPTTPSQHYCTQCRNDLMIRVAPRSPRSISTTILAVLWGISAVLTILGGLAYLALGFLGGALLQSRGPQAARVNNATLMAEILIPGIIVLILGGLFFLVTRGLFQQARWAYIVHLILTVLGTIGAVVNVVQGGVVLATLSRPPSGQLPPDQARIANMIGTILGVALFCAVVWQLIYIVLTVLSWRDFFGPKVRFLPEVDVTDHLGHYNNGVAYKNRGMWYMAAREWEAAVSKAPHDLNYLHALGLAYAQIKQFAKARTTLDRALQIAPADPRIQDSRALVDKLAGRGK
jgi:tetratricopeptide (TPR) repeat protein